MKDDLGDRMKEYEGLYTSPKLLPMIPSIARLDGRSFHTFCKGLDRPFDIQFCALMRAVTAFLIKETNACYAYQQSDEITLVWLEENYKSQIFFNGKIFKIQSVLAAMTSVEFNRLLPDFLPNKVDQAPVFDCRVWNVPNKVEAANTILWRELDATRNSITMAAQSVYSHKQLHGKNTREMQDMLHEKGINWNDYPAFCKRGSHFQKTVSVRPFTPEELTNLPPKHDARKNPDLEITRTDWAWLDLPPFSKVANKIEVIFDKAKPTTGEDDES